MCARILEQCNNFTGVCILVCNLEMFRHFGFYSHRVIVYNMLSTQVSLGEKIGENSFEPALAISRKFFHLGTCH